MNHKEEIMSKSTEYLELYRRYLAIKNYRPHTKKAYIKSIEKYFSFVLHHVDRDLSAVEYASDYLFNLHYSGYSWSYYNVRYSALVVFFKQVLHQEWDYKVIPRPKLPSKLPNILSHDEVSRLISSIRNLKHQTLVLTLYAAGCRISELLNLEVEDIDVGGGLIRINDGKGGKDRIIHMSQKYFDIINGYLEIFKPNKYVFQGQGSTKAKPIKYSASSVRKIIRRAAKSVKISRNISPHTLRHSYATHNLDFGTNMEYLRRQLGHKNLNTTGRYLHLCRYQNQHIKHPIDHLEIQYVGAIL